MDSVTDGKNGTSTDRALVQIKNAIIEGSLAPGAVVSEHELSVKLKMSRTPVHQALDRLRADGWVTITPRAGVTVSGLDVERMRNIYEVLIALEGAAAMRFDGDDEEAIAKLISAEELCENALRDDDLLAWANADNAFHALLLTECGNTELVRIAGSVMDHAHRARLLTVRLRPWPEASNRDHREIVGCISRGNREGARAALQRHRERGMAAVLPILETLYPSTAAFLRR
jgi:DNA-binding GntR family transcriptional regulator